MTGMLKYTLQTLSAMNMQLWILAHKLHTASSTRDKYLFEINMKETAVRPHLNEE